jgi:predicted glycosyltransferase
VEASKRAQFVARLQQQGLDGGQVSVTTDLPLFAVVQSADVVVAHSSTVIQEAAQFGVPSVVTSDYGAEFHADLVRKGQALKATTPTTIAQAVQSLAGRPRLASPLAARDGLLQAAVDELFIRAPQRQPSPEVSR